jgi:hypothetical protein
MAVGVVTAATAVVPCTATANAPRPAEFVGFGSLSFATWMKGSTRSG